MWDFFFHRLRIYRGRFPSEVNRLDSNVVLSLECSGGSIFHQQLRMEVDIHWDYIQEEPLNRP